MSGNPLAAKNPKVLIFLIPFVVIVAILANIDRKTPLDFEANGKVVWAEWNTKNHGMHLFIIKQNNPGGIERKFEGKKIILTPDNIKLDDIFKKLAGSKNCIINDVEIKCLE